MNYTVHKGTLNGKETQYVTFRHTEKITSDKAIRLLARESRMSTADIVRALYALETFLVRQLEAGKIVELKPLGTFSLSLKTKKMIPGESFRKSQIQKASIHFRPNKKTKIDTSHIHFNETHPLPEDWEEPIPHEID